MLTEDARERKRATDRAYYVKNAHAIKANVKRWRHANKERVRQWTRENRKLNVERIRANGLRWYWRNKERSLECTKKWQEENKDRFKAQCAIWMKEHGAAKQAKRRASKMRATPQWADSASIKAIYAASREMTRATGQKWVVDHVVPLRSRLVCGLHVESNLQLLPFAENAKKHNRYWPDMPLKEQELCPA